MTTFVDIIDRTETLIIDGYSSAKTINGVMHDIARIMKKVLPNEYDTFMTANKKEAESLLKCTPKGSEGGFFIEDCVHREAYRRVPRIDGDLGLCPNLK